MKKLMTIMVLLSCAFLVMAFDRVVVCEEAYQED